MVKGYIACPKLGALPDASRASVAQDCEIITVDINVTKEPLAKTLTKLGVRLGFKTKQVKVAVKVAFETMAQKQAAEKLKNTELTGDKYLLLGHPYTVNDAFIAAPVVRKLKKLNVPVEKMTFEDNSITSKEIMWCTFEKMNRRLLNLNTEDYAGVIQISTFNCGADSMMTEYFRHLCSKRDIPYMVIMLDEHSAQAGIDTRLEAFVDSLAWRKRQRMLKLHKNLKEANGTGN
jgi:predicted nucleotide-binding protein (sugar kinase/HSP70/actin superfamily)